MLFAIRFKFPLVEIKNHTVPTLEQKVGTKGAGAGKICVNSGALPSAQICKDYIHGVGYIS